MKRPGKLKLTIGIMLHILYSVFVLRVKYSHLDHVPPMIGTDIASVIIQAIGYSILPIGISLLFYPLAKYMFNQEGKLINITTALYIGLLFRVIITILYAASIFNALY